MKVLRVGHEKTVKGSVNTVAPEGSDCDILEGSVDTLTAIELLKDYKLKLHEKFM